MQYKAIVFDLDGTAVANKLEAMPSERLIRAINHAKGRLHLIAATGRTTEHALPIVQALGLTDPSVVMGGATIIEPASGKIVHEALFSQPQLDAITDVCRDYPFQVRAGHQAFDESVAAKDCHLIAPVAILFVAGLTEDDVPKMIKLLSAIPGVSATSAKAYTGGYVLNLTTVDGTKEHGIGRVLTDVGIQKAETIGIGDGDNDSHLFTATAHHIAMGNASAYLKSLADEIAPSINEDGLAQVIERFSNL
jgi:hydroxymethylpyrimidine pyrophosphatase-like HAD family hydrolase